MTDASDSILRCDKLGKRFSEGGRELVVLDELDLTVRRGESLAIVGASGAGKTTLLQILGGLDTPTSGSVHLRDHNVGEMSEAQRGRLRNELLGFVYQFHHLLPEFSALENVAMPLLIRGGDAGDAYQRATAMLTDVGLGERLDHKPAKLSGGERQRAAVARAMVSEPALILADEPTGNLDGSTGQRVFSRLLELNAGAGTALVVVTHDHRIARQMDRVLRLTGGRLEAVDHADT
ncbi:MAG: ABC transporter ATP-binding protein [Gammaproteobacteria bacterium]